MFLKEPYGALVQTNIFSLGNLGKKLPVKIHLALHLALRKARGRGRDPSGRVRLRRVACVHVGNTGCAGAPQERLLLGWGTGHQS